MARNAQVNKRRAYREEVTGVEFNADAEAQVVVSGPRQIDSTADVSVQAYGTGDADANEGYVVIPTGVGENEDGQAQVTLHAYQGGGAGSPLDDLADTTLDHVLVEAEGL